MAAVFDACVIGTGAGGGVAIQELCEAGLSVVALDRGPELGTADFDEDELSVVIRDALFSPEQVETFRRHPGERAAPGRYNQMAHAVGGAFTRWAGWAWRFREDEFRVLSAEGPVPGANLADWPLTYRELEPFYARAERDFGVAGTAGANPFETPRCLPAGGAAYPLPPHPPRRGALHFEAAARRLGLHPFPLPVAINSQPYGGRPRCTWGGACQGFGCPIHAKASSLSVCLPRARATGRLDLRPATRVVELVPDASGRVRAARTLDGEGREGEVRARHFFLAANAVGTAHLLLLSRSARFPDGLANGSGQVGRNLMLHHGATVRVVLDEPALGFTGFEAFRALDDLHPSNPKRGFIRGGVVAEVSAFTRQPIVYALHLAGDPRLGRGFGEELMRSLEEFPRALTLGSVLEDLPVEGNRVDLDPEVRDADGLPAPRITRSQHPNDIAMNRWFRDRLLELGEACGGSRVFPLLVPGVTTIDEEHPVRGGAHLMGTCRMGTDPERSVVDSFGRAHEVPNLVVVDGSVFPTSAGYNPTLTILALAYRAVDHFLRAARRFEA